jgi:hypothetical protein
MSITTIPGIFYPLLNPRVTAYAAMATLDAAEELVAAIIRIPKTGTLSKVGWLCNSVTGSSYTLKISIETVAEAVGQPVATTNAGKTLYATGAESADINSLTAGVKFTEINGSTGISVSAGDLVAFTFRLTAVSGSSLSVGRYLTPTPLGLFGVQWPYVATYLGGAWVLTQYSPLIMLEYSDGFVPVQFVNPLLSTVSNAFNSSSNPDRRGMKFRYPFKCRISGVVIRGDFDHNCNIILYDSDEYTVASGFPISINALQRRATDEGDFIVLFPTKFEANANTWYRIVVLPTTTSNIFFLRGTVASDGSVDGMDAFPEGSDIIYTAFNGVPSSGSHVWTDTETDKPSMQLIIDGIEASTGAAGGISRSRQLMG